VPYVDSYRVVTFCKVLKGYISSSIEAVDFNMSQVKNEEKRHEAGVTEAKMFLAEVGITEISTLEEFDKKYRLAIKELSGNNASKS